MSAPVKHSQGIAILYAVLLTSVILSIGLLLMDIVTKQIILASTGRNSQSAFYAANLGVECAEYWDNLEAFGFTEGGTWDNTLRLYDGEGADGLLTCVGQSLPDSQVKVSDSEAGGTFETDFQIDIPQPTGGGSGLCVKVTVEKYINLLNYQGDTCNEGLEACGDTLTTVRGYNTPCDEVKDNPRTLERSIRFLN